jgi:REP element-mobilizing transposase RayT
MKQNFWKDILIEILDRALKKYRFKLIAYQIMDNHFHFVITTTLEGATISRIMQYIKARFAERYNKIMNISGPFWNDRFKDKIIEHSDNPQVYFCWLLWYLAYNPVRSKTTSDPRYYQYGCINCYLREDYQAPITITIHKYYINLGKSFKERLNKFLYYEEAYRKRLAIWV